ncbi:hypothetical protein N340_00513, partial [Tauraco erythrolophus]
DQWPLKLDRLQEAHALVKEQLDAGDLVPSTSPWNTPIFVIPKKSGKYRLLHDLRAVNNKMQAMGALQPGLPSPAVLPKDWPLTIIDLKDCFFTIPLHPADSEKFAFSVPAINKQEPTKRYQWVVLPQGMKNSPTICQLYVASALQPLRDRYQKAFIYHYMDDILFAQETPLSHQDLDWIHETLAKKGLSIAPEKIQQSSPWKYLGWVITNSHIKPQKLQLQVEIRTLRDAQKLMGDLQWLRPVVGFTNDEM